MTPELHEACAEAGLELVAWLAAYLASTPAPEPDAAVRRTLAEVLADWEETAAADGVDARLVAAVGPLAAASAEMGALSPVSYTLRVTDAMEPQEAAAAGRLYKAALAEVDAALWAAKLA